MRTVFLVELRHRGQIPRDLRDVLELMGWSPLRPGVAYVLDWEDAVDAPDPGSVWDRIETVMDTARRLRIGHRLLTMHRQERIPLVGNAITVRGTPREGPLRRARADP